MTFVPWLVSQPLVCPPSQGRQAARVFEETIFPVTAMGEDMQSPYHTAAQHRRPPFVTLAGPSLIPRADIRRNIC